MNSLFDTIRDPPMFAHHSRPCTLIPFKDSCLGQEFHSFPSFAVCKLTCKLYCSLPGASQVRWANMQSAVLHQAAPHQLAAEFKAARHAKLDQFKALMQARVLPSAGGPALGPPQVSIQGLTTSSESVSTIGLPFSNATATGQQATREEQAGPSRGQHVHQAQEFGQPGSFQPQSSFVAGATPASQPSSQQHGFGTAFGQTGGMSKPSFGTAATGT